jgi:hypothetical protein
MDLISKKDLEQQQNAGDNSTQIMVAGNVNVGITEQQARDICRAECAIALQNWAFQAGAFAEERIKKLEDKVLPKMLSYDKSLSIFGDPGFQTLLRKAQIAAASSERENDYEILSDLLLHRAEQDNNRERRLGISKAIEVVDQIDEIALIALSIVYAISKYTPNSPGLNVGLSILDDFYGKILDQKSLPTNTSWMEHLDLLSAIRLSPKGIRSFKKMEEYIPEKLKIYFEKGLKIGSDDYKLVMEKFKAVGIPLFCFEPHPLKEGYVHLTTPREVERILLSFDTPQGPLQIALTEQQKEAFEYANSINFTLNCKDKEMTESFWKIWEGYPNLKEVRAWWNKLEYHFQITPVGEALANAYIRGKEPSIPPMY